MHAYFVSIINFLLTESLIILIRVYISGINHNRLGNSIASLRDYRSFTGFGVNHSEGMNSNALIKYCKISDKSEEILI